jgi:hypothetical protein
MPPHHSFVFFFGFLSNNNNNTINRYYNDLPRFLEALSDNHIVQESCLHANANLASILVCGNGMYKIWHSGTARIFNDHRGRIHDFGACTVKQLLFGYDDALDQRVGEIFNDANDDSVGDDTAANATATAVVTTDDDLYDSMYYYYTDEMRNVDTDDFASYNDGSNPCLRNPHYYAYLQSDVYADDQHHDWDYILLNDNTRSPARRQSRDASLAVLIDTYVPWLLETKATPIFLCTYAYWSPYRDMGGLDDVPTFTALTMAGYQAYADAIADLLPASQRPRLALVGLAFLMVWEENRSLWERLFHVDQVHCGPIGTYLQGLVVHHSIFGRLPHPSTIFGSNDLWLRIRRFQPIEHDRDPFPTPDEAAYLYQIALRVCVYQQVPSSYVPLTHGEAVDYVPVDDAYRVDDLF